MQNIDRLREEILSIVHLCACQAMDTDDLERVESLEETTVNELADLFKSHQQALLKRVVEELPKKKFVKEITKETVYWANNYLGYNQALEEVILTIDKMRDINDKDN